MCAYNYGERWLSTAAQACLAMVAFAAMVATSDATPMTCAQGTIDFEFKCHHDSEPDTILLPKAGASCAGETCTADEYTDV